MTWWDRLRDRAAVELRTQLVGPAPMATRAAEPAPGRVGPRVFRADALGPTPTADASEREHHRLGWFAQQARLAAQGDEAAATAAVQGLEAWLRQDTPGRGPGWEHPTDLAVRIVHLTAGFSWLGDAIPADLQAFASGSVGWHLSHLRARMPVGQGDAHRQVAHLVGLFVGGLQFPAAPDARRSWSEAASALAPALQRLGHPDGSDRYGAPCFLAQSLWLTAIAIAVARANGAALPDAATAAWSRGVRFLDRLAGDGGDVPALGEAPFGTVLAAPGCALPASLRNLAVAWGQDQGLPAPGPDARAAWFGAAAAPPALPAAKAWEAWCFSSAGTAVATLQVRGEALRAIFATGAGDEGPLAHAAPLQLLVDVGGRALLADPGPGRPDRADHNGLVALGVSPGRPHLDVARVDGKKVRLEGHLPLGRTGRWSRDVLLNQQRVRVSDRLVGTSGAVALTWRVGTEWTVSGADRKWTMKAGPHTVVVDLPAELSWRFESSPAPTFQGSGTLAADQEITSSFEVR